MSGTEPHRRGRLLHPRLILREARGPGSQALLFFCCAVLAMAALTARQQLDGAIDRALTGDIKSLAGADLAVRSSAPISKEIGTLAARLTAEGRVATSTVTSFYTMARTVTGDRSLLVHLKAVDGAYPLYGQVVLQSGQALGRRLQPRTAIVEAALLQRLGIGIGEPLAIGNTTLTVSDVLLQEPDRPVDFFSLGPRILVNTMDLTAMDLVDEGSRVSFALLFKVREQDDAAAIGKLLAARASPPGERIETFSSGEGRLFRLYDNFLFFLGLVAVFTLLLAGVAMQSTVAALLRSRRRNMAVLKTIGAPQRFLLANYLAMVLGIGLLGSVCGLLLGRLLAGAALLALAEVLPRGTALTFSPSGLLAVLATGAAVAVLFSFAPLWRLQQLRPALIFSDAPLPGRRGWRQLLPPLAAVLFLMAVVLGGVRDLRNGLLLAGITSAGLAAVAALTGLAILLLGRLRVAGLRLRLGLRGLFRPGNASWPVLFTLTAATGLLLTLFLVQRNLETAFTEAFPPEAPNLYLIDIQPDQVAALQRELGRDPLFHPIVRARVEAINGRPLDRERELEKRRDNLGREFSLTYRDRLLADETLIEGDALFAPDRKGPQVSVLEYMARPNGIAVGDRITFNIQGMPVTAEVASIRRRTEQGLQPFFVFVFEEKSLRQAPHTFFAGIRVPPSERAALQNRVVALFPNISIIDLAATLELIGKTAGRFATGIRFFAAFSILAGLLLLVSSIAATRAARVAEAVYFKILGARRRFVAQVFAMENLLLGTVSATAALLIAQLGGWYICSRRLDLDYHPFLGETGIGAAALVGLALTVGWLMAGPILRQRPVDYLRQSGEEG